MITDTTVPEITPKGRSLPYPYPIALSPVLSNYGFYCYRSDGGFCFHHFHAAYAAKKFIETIIDGREYKWLRDDTILLDNGTRIRGERAHDLEHIIEYTPTPREAQWEPTSPDINYWKCFLGQTHIHVAIDSDTGRMTSTQYNPKTEPHPAQARESAPAKRKPVPEAEKVQRRKAKAKSGDYITISTICEELGRDPRECRAMLRKLKMEKPAHGWAWPKSEADAIRNKMKKLLK